MTEDRSDVTLDGRSSPQPRETSHAMLIALILFSVVLAAVAQLTLKHGVDQVTASSGTLQLSGGSLRDVLTTPTVWAGLFLFGLSAVVWLGPHRVSA